MLIYWRVLYTVSIYPLTLGGTTCDFTFFKCRSRWSESRPEATPVKAPCKQDRVPGSLLVVAAPNMKPYVYLWGCGEVCPFKWEKTPIISSCKLEEMNNSCLATSFDGNGDSYWQQIGTLGSSLGSREVSRKDHGFVGKIRMNHGCVELLRPIFDHEVAEKSN